MSTTAVTAGQVMDRVAILLNDPNKTDYTYAVMLPYLNMAIDELSEYMEESQNSPSVQVTGLFIPKGPTILTGTGDDPVGPTIVHYPDDLVEIQEIREKVAGSTNQLTLLPRVEILQNNPPTSSLQFWIWIGQRVGFNQPGSNADMNIQLTYLGQGVPYVANENSVITMVNSRSYLSFKTAAFCCMFIGENETRAQVLDNEAERAVERVTAISNKGRQQIATRHRPFRANYKARGWL